MLSNLHERPTPPSRVVVVGAGGFIGGALFRRLLADGLPVLGLGRPDLDLLADGAATVLGDLLRPDDTLIIASAKAPVRDRAMLHQSLFMMDAVCSALEKCAVGHVVYLSSDAVYADSSEPLSEQSCAAPASLHGVMHLARELEIRASFSGPLAVVRPTLTYGFEDPHNGYGPNRFMRLAARGEEIVVFGRGEERRDHVCVDDIAELMRLIVLHKSEGIVNAVTGEVVSFSELAHFAAQAFDRPVNVRGVARTGPMPHNGYRAFRPSAGCVVFPTLSFRSWRRGLDDFMKRCIEKPQ